MRGTAQTVSARSASGRSPTLRPQGLGLSLAGVGLIFLAHSLYGAMVAQTAMSISIFAALILVVCLAVPGLNKELSSVKGLEWPGFLFGLVLLVALWTLTPYTPQAAAPVWGFTGQVPGATTVNKSATIFEIIKLLGLACLFLIGSTTAASDDRARTAYLTLLGLGATFSLWTFMVHVTGHAGHGGPRFERMKGQRRR